MTTDPTMAAALRYVRPSLLRRAWRWYARVTGWEMHCLQKRTGLKIRSTAFPTISRGKPAEGITKNNNK